MNSLTISIIIPSYNEALNLPNIVALIAEEMGKTDYNYEILIIDDGSSDGTLEVLCELAFMRKELKYISLTRNFGKEAAILAGLQHAGGHAVIIMDADLQHPPALFPQLIKGFEEGYDQVVAKRNRQGDSPSRVFMASLYYRLVNAIIDVRLTDGEGDFRILSRRQLIVFSHLVRGIGSQKDYILGLALIKRSFVMTMNYVLMGVQNGLFLN